MNETDYKELAKQEPEFAEFVKDVIFSVFIKNKDFMRALYGFYSIGTTVKQTTQWMQMNMDPPQRESEE